MSDPRLVYLFRAGKDPDPYEQALAEKGFAGVSISVLTFEPVRQKELREVLEHPKDFAGMILTSPRAVDMLAEAMTWLPTENALWHTKRIFAVGPRTADELRAIGFDAEGEECGSAADLARHIVQCDFERPLLFLCGSRRRDDLPSILTEAGMSLEELCVYETHTKDRLELPPAWQGRAPDWVVFFSPSGLETVVKDGSIDLTAVKVCAIGPTTAEALRAAGLRVDAVAKVPTPEGLVSAIVSAASKRTERGGAGPGD